MYYYFSAINPVAIKIGGAYFGTLIGGVKPINIETENTLIEILALDGTTQSFNFILSNDFISSPPNFASVTDMQGGYLIKILNYGVMRDFSVLCQTKIENSQITVYNDNGLKISLETPKGFFVKSILGSPKKAEVFPLKLNDNIFFGISLLDDKTTLYIFNENGQEEFCSIVDFYDVNDGLTVTESFFDMAKHTVKKTLTFNGEKIVEQHREVESKKQINIYALPQKLLPYAFLEELLVNGNFSEYLSKPLQEKVDGIKDFFGDFIGVTPPPSFRSYDEVGLIYKTGEQTYKIEYATFNIVNGKIDNFKIL